MPSYHEKARPIPKYGTGLVPVALVLPLARPRVRYPVVIKPIVGAPLLS